VSQQFHPEFGYLHPLARLRRDVRVALASFASGAVLGAVAIVAVYVSYPKPETASTPGFIDVAAETRTPPAVMPESPMPEHPNQQRPFTAENTAVIARLPLGRPDTVDLVSSPSRPQKSPISESVAPTHMPHTAVETSPDLRTGAEAARTGSGRGRARQEKTSTNLIGGRDLVHRERRETSTRTRAAVVHWKETAPQAHASAYAAGRTVFWDWSR
jgi:hypothetical protein